MGDCQVVRETALRCLGATIGLSYTRVYPLRTQVCGKLECSALCKCNERGTSEGLHLLTSNVFTKEGKYGSAFGVRE